MSEISSSTTRSSSGSHAGARAPHSGPRIVWFTGLSGAGKSTLARAVGQCLSDAGVPNFILDADAVRAGLSSDLGFSLPERRENIRRIAEVARLISDGGMIALVACISPLQADRDRVRAVFPSGAFAEVYVDTPLDVAERRDPKGLYARARRGEIRQFTGLDSPFEVPANPDLRISAGRRSIELCTRRILQHLFPCCLERTRPRLQATP